MRFGAGRKGVVRRRLQRQISVVFCEESEDFHPQRFEVGEKKITFGVFCCKHFVCISNLEDDDEITKEFNYYVTKRRSSKLLTVHTDDGFQGKCNHFSHTQILTKNSLVLEAIRMVTCKKLRYAWNAKTKCFVKLKGLEADVTKNELRDFYGYSKPEQIIK